MNIVKQLIRKRREVGFRGVCALVTLNLFHLVSTMLDRGFDLRYGTDTSQPVHGPQLGVDHHETRRVGTSYFPTPSRTFRKAMKNLQLDFSDYRFVEFGSGKARVVIMAAMYPFKAVVGVEYSRLLHDVAEKNLDLLRAKRIDLAPMNIYCMDAADYDIPTEPCVFYFFHPFTGDMVRRMFDRITKARDKAPQPDRIVWLYGQVPSEIAWERQLIESYGFVVARELKVRDQGGKQRLLHIFKYTAGRSIWLGD